MTRYLFLLLFFVFSTYSLSYTFETHDYPIHSQERYDLMKAYSKRHYGLNHANLIDPKMIVIHYTAMPTLESSLKAFKASSIASYRNQLTPYGDVNVGVHFVVDRDGVIYTLLPTTLMGRHTVGYNYTAIGIENVASTGDGLTDEQIKANAIIVDQLLFKHPSIRYLIGHMEYMNQRLPHFKLFKSHDKTYTPKIKIDPGFKFMKRLRRHLEQDFGIVLLK